MMHMAKALMRRRREESGGKTLKVWKKKTPGAVAIKEEDSFPLH